MRRAADLAVQALLFLGALLAYELVRGLVAGTGPAAVADAQRVIALERALHLFVEPAAERLVQRGAEPLMDICVWVYLNAQFLVTLGVLAYLYARRREEYSSTRDTLLIAMAIALVGYAVYPAAPPRLVPGYGFTDPVRSTTGISTTHGIAAVLINPYAAIPSMHVGFALALGRAMARVSAHGTARALWRAYPLAIAVVVVATGNHLLTDIALGAMTALVAERLARALRPAPAPPPAALPA